MPEDYSDFWFMVAAVILGITLGLLIGIPLWLATGYPDYVRLFFFLGLCISGLIGAAITGNTWHQRKNR